MSNYHDIIETRGLDDPYGEPIKSRKKTIVNIKDLKNKIEQLKAEIDRKDEALKIAIYWANRFSKNQPDKIDGYKQIIYEVQQALAKKEDER